MSSCFVSRDHDSLRGCSLSQISCVEMAYGWNSEVWRFKKNWIWKGLKSLDGESSNELRPTLIGWVKSRYSLLIFRPDIFVFWSEPEVHTTPGEYLKGFTLQTRQIFPVHPTPGEFERFHFANASNISCPPYPWGIWKVLLCKLIKCFLSTLPRGNLKVVSWFLKVLFQTVFCQH